MREYFCGLDVATAETAVCVVDDKGDVALETKVPSDPVPFENLISGEFGDICGGAHRG